MDYILDHRIALSLGGTNFPANIQLLCNECAKEKDVADRAAWWQKYRQTHGILSKRRR
jgi:5-methylcytosine-specific restriction endonuclease McrA